MSGKAAARDIVNRMFCAPRANYGPYDALDDVEELLEGVLYRQHLSRVDDRSTRYELLLYLDATGVVGTLWEQEVRALLRLSALGHPALPEIHQGGFDDGERFAYTLTHLPGAPLDPDAIIAQFLDDPSEAVRQLSLLLDGLAYLHDLRIQHRNLTPAAIQVQVEGDGQHRQTYLLLKRFEMSTFINNVMVTRGRGDDGGVVEQTRRVLLTPPPGQDRARHLAYLAPERLPFLFATGPAPRHEWGTTDVYGLGVLAWEWFCGPLPTVLPDEYAAVANVAEAADGQAVAALARLNQAMRRHLVNRGDLPAALTDLLRNAIHPHPRERWTAYQCARKLEHNWDSLMGRWDRSGEASRPYLVAFMPIESAKTLYIEREAGAVKDPKRQWLRYDPRSPAGRDELAAFLRHDLRRASLVHSPTGAEGYASGDNKQKLRRAKWVLVGAQAVWFCEHLVVRGIELKDILVIKFVKEIEAARELALARPRRLVGQIDLISWEVNQPVPAQDRAGRPVWTPLLDSVLSTRHRSESETDFLRSLDFLLKFQQVELQAREFAFMRDDTAEAGGQVRLRVDRDRDDARRHSSDLLSAYSADGRRKPFGTFLAGLDSPDPVVRLQLTSRTDRPAFAGDRTGEVRYVQIVDRDTVIVEPLGGYRVPPAGWLRPADDRGSHVSLSRQFRARATLELVPGLVRNLWLPHSMDTSRGRWQRVAERFRLEEKRLEGEAPTVIGDILSLHPFYALQGPPGTGKSTVAARAVKYYLDEEPTARVLVSAQSNFALDNLAEGIRAELGPKHLVLREAPLERVEDVVSDAMKPQVLPKLTRTTMNDAVARAKRRLTQAERDPDGPPPGARSDAAGGEIALDQVRRDILQAWVDEHESLQVEMSDRIRRVANVVCATCSQAGAHDADVPLVGAGAPADVAGLYDWVIVDSHTRRHAAGSASTAGYRFTAPAGTRSGTPLVAIGR